jgi:molybdenum cofactor cytidylyltransferase
MTKPRFACVLLAAGKSSRMQGPNKLLLKVQGESLVHRTARKIMKINFSEVIFVTGHDSENILKELADFSVQKIFNPNFATGMHTSIRAALQNMDSNLDGFFICLADQPDFDFRNLEKMMQMFQAGAADSIVFPMHDGKRGNPVLISMAYRDEVLAEPDGDFGCAYLFKRHPKKLISVEIESDGILVDIDSPQDYKIYGDKNAP